MPVISATLPPCKPPLDLLVHRHPTLRTTQITKLTNTSFTVLANMTAAFSVTCWVLTAEQMLAQFSSQPPTAAQVVTSGTILGSAKDLGMGLDGAFMYGHVSPGT